MLVIFTRTNGKRVEEKSFFLKCIQIRCCMIQHGECYRRRKASVCQKNRILELVNESYNAC